MRVLFVCRGNIARSQMAMEFFNQLAGGGADSGGTGVAIDGQRIGERPGAKVTIDAMNELGIDMSNNISRQIHEADLPQYDKVVVLSEPAAIPKWLRSNKRSLIREFEDPRGQAIEKVRPIRDQIREYIAEFVATNN